MEQLDLSEIESLPNEILYGLLKDLPDKDLSYVCMGNSRIRSVCELIWKDKFQNKSPTLNYTDIASTYAKAYAPRNVPLEYYINVIEKSGLFLNDVGVLYTFIGTYSFIGMRGNNYSDRIIIDCNYPYIDNFIYIDADFFYTNFVKILTQGVKSYIEKFAYYDKLYTISSVIASTFSPVKFTETDFKRHFINPPNRRQIIPGEVDAPDDMIVYRVPAFLKYANLAFSQVSSESKIPNLSITLPKFRQSSRIPSKIRSSIHQ